MSLKKLAVFDFDSTLCEIESLDEFARALNILEFVEPITKAGMRGEITFNESIKKRIKLLKGVNKKTIEEIYSSFPLTKGACEIIKYLKNQGYKIAIFSGGFDCVLTYFNKFLKADICYANSLIFDENDILTGEIKGDMMYDDSKGLILEKLQTELKISKELTLVIGDGANDISMFKKAKISIAFCAKPKVKESATFIIDDANLLKIKNYI